ncbi:MAG: ADOP family duplicated permease [Vicinamibacterales bacterium]
MGLGDWLRRRSDRRMDAEMRFHLDSLAADYEAQGHDRAEAERLARRDFGPVALARDECRDLSWSVAAEHLAHDVRLAWRGLRRSPGFTAAVLVTLALGVGANTAIFQLVDALRLRTLPVPEAERLAIVHLADTTAWKGRRTSGYPVVSNPLWETLRETPTPFEGVLAFADAEFRLGTGEDARPVRGVFVSGGYFRVLGIGAPLGRVFTERDDVRGCGVPGAVVSHAFWQAALGADPHVIGREVVLNGQPVPILGVTPPGFSGVEIGRPYDVAVPVCAHERLGAERGWLDSRTTWWLTAMGRLRPGGSLASAAAALQARSAGLFEATAPAGLAGGDRDDYLSLRLTAASGASGVSALRTQYGDPLLVLLGATALILLIACTNIANLILARASARDGEFAVRLAIGASRRRLLLQLLVEHGLLAVAGAALGLWLATAGSAALARQLASGQALATPVDLTVVGFVAGLAVLMCLGFGIVPAWRASRTRAAGAMRAAGRRVASGGEGARARQVLVVTQVALSFVLLVGALLFTGTLRNLLAVDVGFDADEVVVVHVDYAQRDVPADGKRAFVAGLLERLRAAPGVSTAAEIRHVPLGGTGSSLDVWLPGAGPDARQTVRLNATSSRYFETMGMPLMEGRDFTEADAAGAPYVAVVTPTFARRLGLGEQPVGARFTAAGPPSSPEVAFEVVGLVRDAKYFSLREDPLPVVYVPLAQIGDPRSRADFVVRLRGAGAGGTADLARALAGDPVLRDARLDRLDATVRDGLVRERLMAFLSMGLGLLAVVIVAVGLYATLSYAVSRRTTEIGVRVALGAARADIVWMVLGQALRLLAAGLLAGGVLAVALAGFARSLVFGIEPRDPLTIALAALVLATIAVVAACLPARRAARLEPLAALRQE